MVSLSFTPLSKRVCSRCRRLGVERSISDDATYLVTLGEKLRRYHGGGLIRVSMSLVAVDHSRAQGREERGEDGACLYTRSRTSSVVRLFGS